MTLTTGIGISGHHHPEWPVRLHKIRQDGTMKTMGPKPVGQKPISDAPIP